MSLVSSDADNTFRHVLDFWLPRLENDSHAAMVKQFEWWFGGGATADVATRFQDLWHRARRGELDHWATRPHSRLALIIVLDQFSRSLHPGSADAYACDASALALAVNGIELGHYAYLDSPWEKTFFFLPLGHSEELKHLDAAVRLADSLARQAPLRHRMVLEHSAGQARGHRDVIARFGRHPHRNAVLGRESTADEIAFLARGELVHQRKLTHLQEKVHDVRPAR